MDLTTDNALSKLLTKYSFSYTNETR